MLDMYTGPILQAFVSFPLVAAVFTLPYMIYCYRKYGSFIGFRILIVYLTILYLMCAFFLVILPLPKPEDVAALTSAQIQIIPFNFVKDIVSEAKDASSIFSNRAVLQVVFNIFLTVPFGVVLHYYFCCSFKKTVFCSFLLSLFFELTQLSGLYFIYPRSYRLCDVDDLLLNTLGGLIGYFVAFPFMKLLPSRREIDEAALKKGIEISWLRRSLSFFIDGISMFVLYMVIDIALAWIGLNVNTSVPLVILLYLMATTLLFKGSTLGMICTKIRVDAPGKYGWMLKIVRALLCVGLYLWGPIRLMDLINLLCDEKIISGFINAIAMGLLFAGYVILLIHSTYCLFKRKPMLYEILSHTHLISYVKTDTEEKISG